MALESNLTLEKQVEGPKNKVGSVILFLKYLEASRGRNSSITELSSLSCPFCLYKKFSVESYAKLMSMKLRYSFSNATAFF